jgi:outer membrane protein TolC
VKSLIFLLFSFRGVVFADLSSLVKELEEGNEDIRKAQDQVQLATFSKNSISAQMGWYLNGGTSVSQNNLEYISTDTRGSGWNFNANLSKPFLWGGTFQVTNSLNSSTAKASSQTTYLFQQGLNYSQDLGKNFLGREIYKNLAIAEEEIEAQKMTKSLVKDNKLIEFYNVYINASLEKALLKLEKNASQRAKKRSELIRSWVKDGLKRKVDWQQAVMTELEKAERVEMANLRIKGVLDSLSKLLHRKVNIFEIDILKKNKLRLQIKGESLLKNKNLVLLSKRINQIKLNIEKSGYSLTPSIKAYADYSSNQYDSELGKSVSEGALWNANNQYTVGVNLTWPLGFKAENIERAKLKVQLNGLSREKKSLTQNLKINQHFLEQQLYLLEESLKSSSKRLILSKNILKEYTKLYDLGQMDLDQVIRAEEIRIGTETSIVNYLAQKERYLANYFHLNGKLKSSLLRN